ncbi:hypothetical protein ACWFMI_25500 [Nocardiopsis terrae]
MATLESLLPEGQMKAGSLGGSGFEDWDGSVPDVTDRIKKEM